MKHYLLTILVLLIAGCGNQRPRQGTTIQSADAETTENITEKVDIGDAQDSTINVTGRKSLNEIRFGNWTDKDWYDNDYFRFLRKFIDACYNGEAECKAFEPYKYALNSKFAIAEAVPFLAGGMFILFTFLDAPNVIFNAWIYSDVDEDTETVVDYYIRRVDIHCNDSELTKEDILSIIEEHPENKLW